MEPHALIGFVLILAAFMDVLVGLFVVAPRLPEDKRGVMKVAIAGGGLVLGLTGVAFLLKWIPLG